jgi:hypothetical protein
VREARILGYVLAGLVLVGCDDGASAAIAGDAGMDGTIAPAPPADAGGDEKSSRYADFALQQPVEAIFLGACIVWSGAVDFNKCSDLNAWIKCARDKCALDACLDTCKEHMDCVTASTDRCPANTACPWNDACMKCMFETLSCNASERCTNLYTCAAPSAGGPCEKLDACCKSQRTQTTCSQLVEALGLLRGDQGCIEATKSEGFLRVYASDPPCTFE